MQVLFDGFRCESRQNQLQNWRHSGDDTGADKACVIKMLSDSDLRASGRRDCASAVGLPQVIENK